MEVRIESSEQIEILDVTEEIEQVIPSNTEGLCNIFVSHTTAGIVINENERRLLQDMENFLTSIVDQEKKYKHDEVDSNAASHLMQLVLNPEVTIPVKNGELGLGTWQSILFVELDGPRTRKLEITLLD